MKYEAGNRFNPDTYFKTEVDSTSVTVKVTGELEGVEVSFDSGDVPEITTLSVTENGTYEAPEGTAYNEVTVNVPNTYTAEDAGKVVVEGALVSQTSTEKTANGTYDTTTNNEVVVNVANSYTAADEGKVVDQGALVAQTSRTVTVNDTYDTTTNNEVVVAVPGPSGSISITQNDTYDVTQYASAVVNVSGSDAFGIALLEKTLSGSVTLPAGVTSLATASLANLPQVTKFILPEGLTSMGDSEFYNDTGLTEIDFPSTFASAGNTCVGNCLALTTITCRAVSVPVLGTNTFNAATNLAHIYVPAESVEAYKANNKWGTFSSIIEAIPTT